MQTFETLNQPFHAKKKIVKLLFSPLNIQDCMVTRQISDFKFWLHSDDFVHTPVWLYFLYWMFGAFLLSLIPKAIKTPTRRNGLLYTSRKGSRKDRLI